MELVEADAVKAHDYQFGRDFIEIYQKGDEKSFYEGKSLIFFSLANTDLNSRYEISDILLENNVDVLGKNKEQEVLFRY